MSLSVLRTMLTLSLLIVLIPKALLAQDDDAKPDPQVNIPKIADEPKTVDPATLVPKALAKSATVDLSDSSLREVVEWIRNQLKIPVLIHNSHLSEEGIPLGEPVSDKLNNEPIYLLLNRLRILGLAWYFEDDILHITTAIAAEERLSTKPYRVSDLFDTGFARDDLEDTIHLVTTGPWHDVEGSGGSLEWLGDVLFVRHTDKMHREVEGFLTALRKHARQTFILDPPQHAILRKKLDELVDVKFQDVPLVAAVKQLTELTKADIRLDTTALREERIRDREPVTLTLSDRKLSTVLRVLLADLELTWVLKDGVLWITTQIDAEEQFKTAVYDVRDLCQDERESGQLAIAILAQTTGPWQEVEGTGGTISFAKNGTMAIRQTESGLLEVYDLLSRYRQALLASKPRKRDDESKTVLTRYYRMHDSVAQDLVKVLPQLVQPETWSSEQKPKAPGSILQVASSPSLVDAKGQVVSASSKFALSRSVLIIRQTRAAHIEIAKVIQRIEKGDPTETFSGKNQGGGGFGGGFFSTRPTKQLTRRAKK